jgi:hypothetical protein
MRGGDRRVGTRLAWGVAFLTLSTLLLATARTGSASGEALQPSADVVVIPGFAAPQYPGTNGVPSFPATAPELAGYHYSELGAGSVTASALRPYDSIVLYGLRWTDLSSTAQAAVNDFARSGKVLIWDSDATGAQNYSTFVHPFSTLASGESGDNHGAVVTFPSALDPLASSDASSPLFISPSALVASTHLIGHMNVMRAGAPDWAPGLIAANAQIPGGGWVLGWGYGSTGDHSGMVVYSGLDADAFHDDADPNYATKELQIELAATFRRAPDPSCAPSCGAPQVPAGGGVGGGGSTGGGGGGGSTGGGTGSGGSTSGTFASCSLERKAPTSWVRGKVPLWLKTSVASGITAQVLTTKGKVVASGSPTKDGRLKLVVDTRLLPSDKQSKLLGVVYVNSARACSVATGLRVDNKAPRLTLLKVRRQGAETLVTLRASEAAHLTVSATGRSPKRFSLVARKTITVTLAGSLKGGSLLLIDRAGNRTVRTLR